MATYTVKGPGGAEVTLEVPSPGMDQETFDRRVEAGDFEVVKTAKKSSKGKD